MTMAKKWVKQWAQQWASKLQLAFLALAGALVLTACASPQPTDYAQEKPVLDLKEYFNGTIDAWGVFQDRSGKVVKRFTVVMKCTWDGNTGVLDEDFTYSDGTTQKRVWTLKKTATSTPAPLAMCWGKPMAKLQAMHFNGNTPCCCQSTAPPMKCSSMTGCTRWMTR